MIRYFKKESASSPVRELSRKGKGIWIDVQNPSEAEFQQLAEQHELDEGSLHDATDPDEIPRFEVDDDDRYVILRYILPLENAFATESILIVLTKDDIITVTRANCPPLDAFRKGKAKFRTTDQQEFLIALLLALTEDFDRAVGQIGKQIRRTQANLRIDNVKNRDFIRFVGYVNTLEDVISVLVSQNVVLKRVYGGKHFKFSEQELDDIEDILIDSQQVTETSKAYLKTIVNIRETYSTIMTNNLNRVIRTLTILTVVLSIPTIVGALYGMNIPLPGAGSPHAFWYIVVGSLWASLVLFVFFNSNSDRLR